MLIDNQEKEKSESAVLTSIAEGQYHLATGDITKSFVRIERVDDNGRESFIAYDVSDRFVRKDSTVALILSYLRGLDYNMYVRPSSDEFDMVFFIEDNILYRITPSKLIQVDFE